MIPLKCRCGRELSLPALFVGYTDIHTPIARFLCGCGQSTDVQIAALKPMELERAKTFPPKRGEYFIATDGVMFTCPICKGMSPIKAPTHSITASGEVKPSIVCPHGCGFHANVKLFAYGS